MADGLVFDNIVAGRLAPGQYVENFADLHPPLDDHEARVEAERCYFCFDAPCQTACPTAIDIPLFIRQIANGNPLGAARSIFDQNILGGMCARVCPTETLCEEVCVRQTAEDKPVKIGHLQRYATDKAMSAQKQFFTRPAANGKTIAIVGAGPAGLACAHRLAINGHQVKIFDGRKKPGGLNEHGIASYKSTDDFAQSEIDYVTAIGGINIETSQRLGRDFTLDDLSKDFDAVFLGIGLGGVNALNVDNSDAAGVRDAVEFIEELRQSSDLTTLPIGRRVVVIGGGMTAVDAAVQAKLLGAEEVTICYRRGKDQMAASGFEQDLASASGVTIRHWLQPAELLVEDNQLVGIALHYTSMDDGALKATGETLTLVADQVFKAIGQTLEAEFVPLDLVNHRIHVDAEGRTSQPNIWAGGDCTNLGDDLTVTAVAQGRDAANSINRMLAE